MSNVFAFCLAIMPVQHIIAELFIILAVLCPRIKRHPHINKLPLPFRSPLNRCRVKLHIAAEELADCWACFVDVATPMHFVTEWANPVKVIFSRPAMIFRFNVMPGDVSLNRFYLACRQRQAVTAAITTAAALAVLAKICRPLLIKQRLKVIRYYAHKNSRLPLIKARQISFQRWSRSLCVS